MLVLLGFVGFYLLWEIKSRYLYPVYPLLLVLSVLGFKDTLALLENGKSTLPAIWRRALQR